MTDRSPESIRHYGKRIEIKSEDRVTLTTILGIIPELYLAFLYGAALLLVLFFILIFPGIINPGSLALCTSEPSGAAIRVDDVTLGYTPCRVFIPRGKRVVEFVLPGFEPDRQELEVGARVFGSLFSPKKFPVTGNLVCRDPAGAFSLAALDYIHWSAAGEPTEAWQIPLSLSEGAYRTGPAAKDPAIREVMEGILEGSLRYAVTEAAARDLLRAQFLIDNAGLSPSPVTLLRSIQEAAALIGDNPAAPWYLEEFLPAKEAGLLVESAWYRKSGGTTDAAENTAGSTGAYDLSFSIPAALTLGTVDFTAVPAGYLEAYGRNEPMPPLLLAREPVSLAAWEAFTAENPGWAAENRETLIAAGFVQDSYLRTVDNPGYPEPAAPGISWYAAAAYCAWLNSKLPLSLAGWEVKLPSEEEWEYGIRQTGLSPGALWEWCVDPYAPLKFFPISPQTVELLEKGSFDPLHNSAHNSAALKRSLERTVRGGSWINPSVTVRFDSRGSLPPETSSPFVGFRPVIVPKQGK